MEEKIKDCLRKIKGINSNIDTCAYNDENWWIISVNDYDFYTMDEEFKSLKNDIRNKMKEQGVNIIFAYRPLNENSLKQIEIKFGKIIKL